MNAPDDASPLADGDGTGTFSACGRTSRFVHLGQRTSTLNPYVTVVILLLLLGGFPHFTPSLS